MAHLKKEKKKGRQTNFTMLSQLKNYWLEGGPLSFGDPITATRVGVWIQKSSV